MTKFLLITLACTYFCAFAKPVKIGFLLSTLQEERYLKDKKYFEDEAKKLGAEVIFFAADNSERTQVKKMENMLTKSVDVIVVQPVNSDAASTLVEMATEEKVPVIAYDRIINNADIAYYVTQDSKLVGKLQAEATAKAINGKGNVVILKGQSGHSVANAITEGFKEEIKKNPGIKIVLEKSHDAWSPSLAMATTENILTKFKGDIAAVVANNSGMANGAVQAITDYDKKLLGKIFVAGADADLAAIKNIVNGTQQFEVFKDFKILAETSAKLAFEVATKKAISFKTQMTANGKKDVLTVNTPVFPVTKDKIDEIIVGRGFHTKEAIYGKK